MERTIQLNRAIILNRHLPFDLVAKHVNAQNWIDDDPFRRLLNRAWKRHFATEKAKQYAAMRSRHTQSYRQHGLALVR